MRLAATVAIALTFLALAACEPTAITNPARVAGAPIAEWPEQKLTIVRGAQTNQVRVLRTDHGSMIVMSETTLPAGVAIIGFKLNKETGTLQVATAQGMLDLTLLADGRIFDPRTAVARATRGARTM